MMGKPIVAIEFADKDSITKRYKVGEELVGFAEERIAKLVDRGIVAIEQEEVLDIDLSEHYKKVISAISIFEDVEKLKQYLEAENEGDKPRTSVVQAIEDRIALLEEEE